MFTAINRLTSAEGYFKELDEAIIEATREFDKYKPLHVANVEIEDKQKTVVWRNGDLIPTESQDHLRAYPYINEDGDEVVGKLSKAELEQQKSYWDREKGGWSNE